MRLTPYGPEPRLCRGHRCFPTCGGYDCEGMYRTEIPCVNGETARKKPFCSSQSPLGSSSAEIVTISLQYILRACSGRVLGPDAAVGHARVALPLELFLLSTRSWSCIPGRISPSDRAGVDSGADVALVPRTGSTRFVTAGEKAPQCRRSPLRSHRGHCNVVLLLRGGLSPCSSHGRVKLESSCTPMAAAAVSRTTPPQCTRSVAVALQDRASLRSPVL